jgi:hypothetical protein
LEAAAAAIERRPAGAGVARGFGARPRAGAARGAAAARMGAAAGHARATRAVEARVREAAMAGGG